MYRKTVAVDQEATAQFLVALVNLAPPYINRSQFDSCVGLTAVAGGAENENGIPMSIITATGVITTVTNDITSTALTLRSELTDLSQYDPNSFWGLIAIVIALSAAMLFFVGVFSNPKTSTPVPSAVVLLILTAGCVLSGLVATTLPPILFYYGHSP